MKYLVCILCFASLLFSSCTTKRAISGPAIQFSKDLTFDSIYEVTIHRSSGEPTGPCEPTISINPFNTQEILAGSVLDNLYRSIDGGETWSISKLKSIHGVFGDPVIRRDKDGNPVYAHLSNSKNRAYNSVEFLDRIVVQKSMDQGKSWSPGTFPKVDHKKDHDKHWLYTDPISGDILMSWTEFDRYGSKDSMDRSRILFSRSVDGGVTWADAIKISEFEGDCIDDDMTPEGAHPCVGIDGTYYVVWSFNGKIYLDISYDKGLTWLSKDKVVSDQVGGWSYLVPGLDRCNGMPVMKCDHSSGIHRGTLYINFSDQRNGDDNTDIWLIKSNDKGLTWTMPRQVNDDLSRKQQFLTWMDIDHTNGHLYFVFYDRRRYNDNRTDVYLGYSLDGGMSFSNLRINKSSFIPDESVFFGDYNDISVHDGHIRPIWTATENGALSVRTSIINVKK